MWILLLPGMAPSPGLGTVRAYLVRTCRFGSDREYLTRLGFRLVRARPRGPAASSPARMVVDRCQARSVWRSTGVREMVRAVVRPRAIQRPCVREVPPGTTWGPERLRDDGREGRPRRHRSPRSPRLRRQTVPGSRRRREDFVTRDNHTISLCLCASAQHRFVGQTWSGPGCRHPPYTVSPVPLRPPRQA